MPEMIVFQRVNCGNDAIACPECVVMVRIDPQTTLPPDVKVVGGKPVLTEPTPEALARGVKMPLCDNCVERRNANLMPGQIRIETGAQRHASHRN